MGAAISAELHGGRLVSQSHSRNVTLSPDMAAKREVAGPRKHPTPTKEDADDMDDT